MSDSELTMTMELPDGTSTGPFTMEDMKRAYDQIKGGPRMKPDPDFEAASDLAHRVAAAELRQFVERFERLDAEKSDILDAQKEVMAEAKGRGYDTKVLRKVIALRKRDASDVAEEDAVLAIYKEALGMSS